MLCTNAGAPAMKRERACGRCMVWIDNVKQLYSMFIQSRLVLLAWSAKERACLRRRGDCKLTLVLLLSINGIDILRALSMA